MTLASTRKPHSADVTEALTSPLFLEGLLEFNRHKWGVTPMRVRFSEDGSAVPAVETVYYLDERGRVTAPHISPYMPVAFAPTPTESRARLDRQWLTVGTLMAADMHRRGVASVVPLAPEVSDVRPWQWSGFNAELRYVFQLELPHDDHKADSAVRKQVAKATRSGFRAERVTRMDDVAACLSATQERQQFSLDVGARDLDVAQQMVGEEALRAYVCYAPNGEPAGTRVVLHAPGTRAIDWLAGVNTTYLHSGGNQLLISHMLNDLSEAGATAFDFSDATHPPVAAMKATWGGLLVPVYTVDGGRVRALARHARDYWSLRRNRASDSTQEGDDA